MVLIYDVTLDKALIFLPTFLDSSEMWLSVYGQMRVYGQI